MTTDNDAPIEEKIDLLLAEFLQDATPEQRESLLESWGKARTMMVDHQVSLELMLVRKRMLREGLDV
jgi:hypothetical protein